MGLGNRGKERIQGKTPPTVEDLFTPTESDRPARGRPRGEAMKAKTFTLPIELADRLRKQAFLQERTEVDIVRAALAAYLDTYE